MMASLILFIVFANAFTSNATITLTENQVKAPIEKYIAESLKNMIQELNQQYLSITLLIIIVVFINMQSN